MENGLYCEICSRLCDERCDLCKYKENAREVAVVDLTDCEEVEDEKQN